MTPDPSGATVLVTGGTGGIGLATATGLAGLGARVGVVGRSAARGVVAADAVRRQVLSARVDVFEADLSSQAEVQGHDESTALLEARSAAATPATSSLGPARFCSWLTLIPQTHVSTARFAAEAQRLLVEHDVVVLHAPASCSKPWRSTVPRHRALLPGEDLRATGWSPVGSRVAGRKTPARAVRRRTTGLCARGRRSWADEHGRGQQSARRDPHRRASRSRPVRGIP